MSEGWSTAAANSALDSLLSTYRWVQMHTGAPGAAGTASVAAASARKQGTFPAAVGAAATNSGDLVWTNVSAAEVISHVSGWTTESGGTFGWSGRLTSDLADRTLEPGDTFTIAAGDIDVSLPVAS